jgi:hypothetical protein
MEADEEDSHYQLSKHKQTSAHKFTAFSPLTRASHQLVTNVGKSQTECLEQITEHLALSRGLTFNAAALSAEIIFTHRSHFSNHGDG